MPLVQQGSPAGPLWVSMAAWSNDAKRTLVCGVLQCGTLFSGDTVRVLPGNFLRRVDGIVTHDADSGTAKEVPCCYPGSLVELHFCGIEQQQHFDSNCVLTSVGSPLKAVDYVQVRVTILDDRVVVTAGTKLTVRANLAYEEVTVHKLLAKLDRQTRVVTQSQPAFVRGGDCVLARLELSHPLVLECCTESERRGRLLLYNGRESRCCCWHCYEAVRNNTGDGCEERSKRLFETKRLRLLQICWCMSGGLSCGAHERMQNVLFVCRCSSNIINVCAFPFEDHHLSL